MGSNASMLAQLTALALVVAAVPGCSSGTRRPGPGDGSSAVTTPDPLPLGPLVAPQLAHAERSIRIGFWLGMPNNELMTQAMIDWLGQRASIIVLNAEDKGPDPYFDYDAIVKRFKAGYPQLPVLLYDTATRAQKVTRPYGASFDAVTRSTFMLKRSDGQPAIQKGKRALIDITSPDFKKYFPDRVARDVARTGTDGVAFDGLHRTLAVGPQGSPDMYQNGRKLAADWPAATTALLAGVKGALGDRLVLYNGLWPVKEGQLENQIGLLDSADGASIEYFGYDAREPASGRDHEFERYVLRLLEVMKDHPDEIYLVFGRIRRKTYYHYREDYLIQRYDLAAYLLAMTAQSTFKYHAHFQTVHLPPDRADGLSYYADYDLDVGTPVGAMVEVGGVYRRTFTRALVAVAPAWQTERTLALDKPYYTPEGQRLEGKQRLAPGTGLILFPDQPTAAPARVVVDDFETGGPGEWKFPVKDDATVIAKDGANHFLQIRLAADAVQPYHERRLQPIKRLDPYATLTFKVRSADPDGAILVRVEVDDSTPVPVAPAGPGDADDDDGDADGVAPAPPRGPRMGVTPGVKQRAIRGGPRPYAIVVIKPDGGTQRFRKRGRDIPFGQLQGRGQVPFLTTSPGYAADGRWHTVTVDARTVMQSLAPHLTPHRVAELRVLGEADLDDLVLTR